jgi:hypothetical protein
MEATGFSNVSNDTFGLNEGETGRRLLVSYDPVDNAEEDVGRCLRGIRGPGEGRDEGVPSPGENTTGEEGLAGL